jgi:DNA-damage-inducible protein J
VVCKFLAYLFSVKHKEKVWYNNSKSIGDIMATLSIKIDDDIKIAAEAEFREIGLSTSAAVNIYFRKVIQEHGIPFKLENQRVSDNNSLPSNIKKVKLKVNPNTNAWQIPNNATSDAKEWLIYD